MRLLPLFALADLAVLVIALIDCLSVEKFRIRALPRFAWVFLILLFSPIGGIAWFVAGRPAHTASAGASGRRWRMGSGSLEPERPRANLAPDDDPEFLNHLAAKAQRENAERLRAWEEDLRRREQELHRQERPDGEEEQKR
jgi:hypothetical protein